MEQIFDRIFIGPNIYNGKPVIREKRISVQTIMEFLSSGETHQAILEQYPSLEPEDIVACLKFTTELTNKSFIIKQAVA